MSLRTQRFQMETPETKINKAGPSESSVQLSEDELLTTVGSLLQEGISQHQSQDYITDRILNLVQRNLETSLAVGLVDDFRTLKQNLVAPASKNLGSSDFKTFFYQMRVGMTGGAISAGYFYRNDPKLPLWRRFGQFISGEGVMGVEAGISASLGYVEGSLEGEGLNANVSALAFSGSWMVNPKTHEHTGLSGGVGLGSPGGASLSFSKTEEIFFADQFDAIKKEIYGD